MGNRIQVASTLEEKKAIFRFRYEVYIKELGKNHIEADHLNEFLFDKADDASTLYFACNNEEIIATTRSKMGSKSCLFSEEEKDLFYIPEIERYVSHKEIAIVDRLMVKEQYRLSNIAHQLMLATYIDGLDAGIRTCFILSEEKFLPMYFRYGFRLYDEPVQLPSGEKRFRLILFLCDANYLQQVKSPFSVHLPSYMDDKGSYAEIIKEKIGVICNTCKNCKSKCKSIC